MSRAMSTLEYWYILDNELKPLVGKHFSKIYVCGENGYRIRIGSIDITIEVGKRICRTVYMEENKELDNLSKKIRKELENARLTKVELHNNDRIVVMEFHNGQKLVFEMFGKGNMVLVKEGKTLACLKNESWSDREIGVGKEYTFPKSNVRIELEDVLTDRYIIVDMMRLPLGKEYVKEILERCGIDEKTPSNKLDAGQRQTIKLVVDRIYAELKPAGIYKEGKIVDYSLIKLKKYDGFEVKEFGSLSEAAEGYYKENKDSSKSEKLEKLERRLEEQENRLKQLEEEEKEKKIIADYLYENYAVVEEILNLAKGNDFEAIEKKYGKKIDVNKKEKTIELEL